MKAIVATSLSIIMRLPAFVLLSESNLMRSIHSTPSSHDTTRCRLWLPASNPSVGYCIVQCFTGLRE